MRVVLTTLILLPIILGPWWLGSYYDEYRWPLIYSTWIAIAASFFLESKFNNEAQVSKWTSITFIVLLISQGLFMLHNTWGQWIENEIIGTRHYFWEFLKLESQPYPSLPGTPDKSEAWDRLSYIIPGLCYFMILRRSLANKALKLSTLAAWIFWTGVSIALLGLAQRLSGAEGFFWIKELKPAHRPLFFATFRSPGIASCYLNLCLAIGLSHLLASTHQISKNKYAKPTHPILIGFGIIIITSGVMGAGSKAGVTLAAIIIIMWLATNVRSIWRLLQQSSSLLPSGSPHERNIVTGAILGAMILALLSFGGLVTNRWERSVDTNYGTLTQRHLANHSMMKVFNEKHPHLPRWGAMGLGPGSFMTIFPFYAHDKTGYLKSKWVYAHNDYLQTLIEWGWLGTSFWLILLGGSGFFLIYEQLAHRHSHRKANLFYFNGAAIGMLAFLIHATVDFPFQIESIAINFAAVMSIGWATTSLRTSRRKPTRKPA